jgi:murein tripeptide amidase MpaA
MPSNLFAAGDANNLVRITVTTKTEADLLPRGLDVTGTKPGESVDAVVTDEQIADLMSRGLYVQLLHKDVEQLLREAQEYYPTWNEFQTDLHAIVNGNPTICTMDTIGYSYELHPIQVVKLSDNVGIDEDEPEVLYTGLTHAREWPGLAVTMFILDSLTSAYGADLLVTALVDDREIYFIPCLNPDGYIYTRDDGHDWRKNRRPFPEWGTTGVDLNRNYAGSTDGHPEGEWGTTLGNLTHSPDGSTYCGPSPFSEVETSLERDFILSRDFCAGLTFHTSGELVLWSWAYGTYSPPNEAYVAAIGTAVADLITQEYGTGTYTPLSSSSLYPTSGDATDWVYGHCHYVKGADFLFFTVEMGDSYQPPTNHLPQIVRENFDGAFYLLEQAGTIRSDLTPRVIPPVLEPLGTSSTGNYTVEWSEVNPAASPEFWQVDELTDLSIITDDVEGSTGRWDTYGFSISTDRAHSGSKSFKSTHQSEIADGLTSIHPYYVQDDDSLIFWTWYDIEIDGDGFGWDYGYAEVSLDGRKFDILAMYTGQSGGWVREAFSLEDYIGESVFFRFRYTTDGAVLEEGFYVDDIYPVPFYNTITTLSSTETDTSYQVSGQPTGAYYYRVRGSNSEWNWCDYSALEPVTVVNENAGDLAGLVTDSVSSDPLSGVLVELLDGSTVIGTDLTGEGNYTFAGINAGTYDVRASADFYETKTIADVQIVAQQVETLDIVLAANWGSVAGVVTNSVTSQTVSGVTIEIKQDFSVVGTDIADIDGTYQIDSLIAGTYDLAATHIEYETIALSGLTVNARDTLNQNLSMPPFAVCGDANGAEEVDIDDVVYIIGYIFSEGPAPSPLWTGDADCTGEIDIDDVVYIINYIFTGGTAPCYEC